MNEFFSKVWGWLKRQTIASANGVNAWNELFDELQKASQDLIAREVADARHRGESR